ncbi:MAG: tautomerase family protein [Thermodesulfobacteriota bacterium]
MPIISVTMVSGRTVEQKRELGEVLARECARICACPLTAVEVVIHEQPAENWNMGGTWGVDYMAARAKAAAAAAKAPAGKAPARKPAAKKKAGK